MTEGVKEQQVAAKPEATVPDVASEKARENFKRLEAAREADREARIRAEMQNEMLRKEMDEIKSMLAPKETDPLDGVEDYVDPARLKAKLEKERANYQREAERIARNVYETAKREDEQKNYMNRLKSELPDFDNVMNEASIERLQQENPVFLEAVLEVKDDYKRRKLTYDYLKKSAAQKPVEVVPSIKEKVEENQLNPYFIQSGSGTAPQGIDFDLKTPASRAAAYEKLKSAQRRSIG